MDDTKKTKILMIDDERLLLDIYVKRFTDAGFDVTSCTEATAGITALKQGLAPMVVLFDINMPGMGGFEFLEQVRNEKLAGTALLIALTNEAQDGERKRIVELGADGHFVKSQLSPSDVVTAVTELLKKRNIV